MQDLRGALRRALATRFGVRVGLDDDTGLFSGGLIDSLSVIELVGFVEGEVGCAIPPVDITLEHFDSINRIVRFAEALAAAGNAE